MLFGSKTNDFSLKINKVQSQRVIIMLMAVFASKALIEQDIIQLKLNFH